MQVSMVTRMINMSELMSFLEHDGDNKTEVTMQQMNLRSNAEYGQ